MKKAPRETQTLRAGCSKASQKFSPAADPLQNGQNLTHRRRSLRHLQTKFGENRYTQFRVIVYGGNRHRPARHRQYRLQYTASLCLACSVMKEYDIIRRVKTYSDPSYIFSEVQDTPNPATIYGSGCSNLFPRRTYLPHRSSNTGRSNGRGPPAIARTMQL